MRNGVHKSLVPPAHLLLCVREALQEWPRTGVCWRLLASVRVRRRPRGNKGTLLLRPVGSRARRACRGQPHNGRYRASAGGHGAATVMTPAIQRSSARIMGERSCQPTTGRRGRGAGPGWTRPGWAVVAALFSLVNRGWLVTPFPFPRLHITGGPVAGPTVMWDDVAHLNCRRLQGCFPFIKSQLTS